MRHALYNSNDVGFLLNLIISLKLRKGYMQWVGVE